MDINQAALELKRVEITEKQIEFLRGQVKMDYDILYKMDCNDKIQELLLSFGTED